MYYYNRLISISVKTKGVFSPQIFLGLVTVALSFLFGN